MKHVGSFALVVGAIALLAMGVVTAAQPATGEIVVSNSGGFHGNAVVAMTRYGAITTILPLPAGAVGGTTVNHLGNEELIAVGTNIYGVNNGRIRRLAGSLPAGGRDVTVDEDNTWAVACGTVVYGINPVSSSRTTIATGFVNATAIEWYGTDGSLLVVDSGDGKIYKISRGGSKQVLATVANVKCLAWDSYTGDVFVGATDVLYRMSQSGGLTTAASNQPGLKNPTAMFLRSDRVLLVTQGNTTPTGVYAYSGKTGRFMRPYYEATSATGLNPVGVTVDHYRDLWPMVVAVRAGESASFRVNFPPMKNRPFVAALSFSHAPGFPTGNFRLHLNLDPLFLASLVTPSLFENYGTLNNDGLGKVTLHVPDLSGLVGLRIFLGSVALDNAFKNGIGEASNCLGVTIQAAKS